MLFSKIKYLNTLLISCFLGLVMMTPVMADLSKEEAIKQAQDRNGGGKVLGVVENIKNGKKSYKIKLISDGKVRVLTIDE